MNGKDVDACGLLVAIILSITSIDLALGGAGLEPEAITAAMVGNRIRFGVLLACTVLLFVIKVWDFLFHKPERPYVAAQLLLVAVVMFLAARVRAAMMVNLCYPVEKVVLVEGRVVCDSSFSQAGNHMMKIMLTMCRTVEEDAGTASGLISAIGDQSEIIAYGTKIRMWGRFQGGLFIYDRLQVLGRSAFGEIRERIIPFLEYRLTAGGDKAAVLSAMLLFGRSDFYASSARDLAKACGCSHILALSGMHLSILASISKKVLGDGKVGKVGSTILVVLFLFVAGPRPSLVRAALGFFLSGVKPKEKLPLVFAIQMVLFPATMVELGCCYGYVAVFAITFLTPYVEAMLLQIMGKSSKLVGATISVMIFSVPVYMSLDGVWYPAVLLASPPATVLVSASMIIGLLMLAFGRVRILVKINALVYGAFESMLGMFGNFPTLGWVGYASLVGIMMTMALSLFVARKIMKRRVRLTRGPH